MRFLLKMALLFYCAPSGEGHWLHALIGQPDETGRPRPSRGVPQGDRERGAGRVRRGVGPPCELRSLLLPVRDLGLGYESEEAVLFKYCSGACSWVRSNHDLTLTSLLQRGALPPPLPGERWHATPCCRPTHHEDLAFLDDAHRWHKVEGLSAAGCTCVG